MLYEKNLLLGSFFFFPTSERRNSSQYVIATIAYQLALYIPETRQHIVEAIERNPIIFSLTLWEQALALIISPFVSIFYNPTFRYRQLPRVIIIDGLDECRGADEQGELLAVLSRITQSVPISVAVLVSSRPEHHIRGAFGLRDLNSCSSRLPLDDSYEPDTDIRKYLVDRLDSIRKDRPMEFISDAIWPSPEDVDTLVQKASGQFIYAATVDKFVSSPRHNPLERLDIILGAISPGEQRPFERLDNLYSAIFRTIDNSRLNRTLRVLGFLLIPPLDLPEHPMCYESHSPAYLEYFLQLRTGDVHRFLYDLDSLLTIHENYENIQFSHASLSDYLFDKTRSEQFWIDSGLIYAEIAEHSIRHLLHWPGKYLCKIWSFCSITFLAEVRNFFIQYGNFLSSNAGSTPELGQAIETCDFGEVIAATSNSELDGMRYLCPMILQIAINESVRVFPLSVVLIV